MSQLFGNRDAVARETNTQFRVGTDRVVGVRKIVRHIKHFHPFKTAAYVATVCKCSVRTAERYVSGEIDYPPEMYIAVMNELHEREGE